MNDRTIRSAPIVADEIAGVKYGPDFPNAHFRALWPRPFWNRVAAGNRA